MAVFFAATLLFSGFETLEGSPSDGFEATRVRES